MSSKNDTGDEQTPLLSKYTQRNERQRSSTHDDESRNDEDGSPKDGAIYISMSDDDEASARAWSKWRKRGNVASIMLLALLVTGASSIFTPGVDQIAQSLGASEQEVNGILTGFVLALGAGPPVLAPLSETFGRRPVYLICFGIFSLLQIPTALIRHLPSMIVLRFLAGFFGSVAVANGGGTLSDLYESSERATILGWCQYSTQRLPHLGRSQC